MMKELYISPEATLVGFVASQNMADIYIEPNPWGDESDIVPTESGTDIEVNLK